MRMKFYDCPYRQNNRGGGGGGNHAGMEVLSVSKIFCSLV